MSEQALPEGDGKNVVNVILVDIRGLDTVGEVTVLVVAAIGIVALARSGRGPAVEPAPAVESEGADR
jgi:multisubunit Na+/H+ antiporter MnhB subunit